MQDGDESVTSQDKLRPLIIRSLRRSNVRKKIAEYLFDISPSGSYTSEIKSNKINNLFQELRGLRVDDFPICGSVALRVILELSVEMYSREKGISSKSYAHEFIIIYYQSKI